MIEWICHLKPPEQIALASALIAFSSLLTSLCALGFSILEVRRNQENRELSVTPILGMISDLGKEKFTLAIENNGLGPARLINVELRRENRVYSLFLWDDVENYFKELGVSDLERIADIELPDPDDFVPAGRSVQLFHEVLVKSIVTELGEESAADALNETALYVEYESVYGVRQPTLLRKLS